MTAPRLFHCDDETRSIGEAARRALESVAPHRALTQGGDDAPTIARRHWTLAIELGWPAILVTEEDGGLGLGLAEMATLFDEIGLGLGCGPFTTSAVLLPSLARLAGGEAYARIAGAIATGEAIVALAVPDTLATGHDPDPRITASSSLVEHPDLATHFLVLDLAPADDGAVMLRAALVARGDAAGIHARQPLDVTCPVAAVGFVRAPAVPGTRLSVRLTRAERDAFLAPLHVAVAAELVGLAQGALDRAVDHVTTRRQFGAVIGSFQAIKHRLADTAMLVANARLAVRHAAHADPSGIAVLAARALATDAALRAAGDCIQLQGGLGFSWENDAHLYLKRARRVATILGSAIAARRSVADCFIASVPPT